MSEVIKLKDRDEYLVPLPGATNTHLDHYHVGGDGTILSIVEDGKKQYNRQELRNHISAVTGMDFPPRDYAEE